jgi:hypothetical protein
MIKQKILYLATSSSDAGIAADTMFSSNCAYASNATVKSRTVLTV